MHRIKKQFFVLLVVISIVITGCGSVKALEINDVAQMQNKTADIMRTSISENPVKETRTPSEKHPATLWVVTEETTYDGMNAELKRIAEAFHAVHSNVEIRLDILPNEESERAIILEKIRAKIAEGNGPDVFLLPTRDILTLDHPKQYSYKRIEMLFPNVDMAMRRGVFLDIHEYYDRAALQLEGLNNAVMDAGIVGNSRFVLPIRYNLPVIYSFDDEVKSLGLDPTDMDKPIDEWMKKVLELGEPKLSYSAEYRSLLALGPTFDYDNKTLQIEDNDVLAFLKDFQMLEKLIGSEKDHRNRAWLSNYLNGTLKHYPAQLSQLDSAMTFAAKAKLEGKQLSMHPVKSTSGEVVATISYYGAVGSCTKNPDLAVEFLLQFLSEESQWEQNRYPSHSEQYPGLWEQSWPVRTAFCIAKLWEAQKYQATMLNYGVSSQTVSNDLNEIALTDEDVPIISAHIDRACFGLRGKNTFDAYWPALNDSSKNGAPTDVNLKDFAHTIIENLKEELNA